jgi:hypothetical protein
MAIRILRDSCCSKVLLLIILCDAWLPVIAQRMVFAHYMLANQDYGADDPTEERNIASYEREIRQAQAVSRQNSIRPRFSDVQTPKGSDNQMTGSRLWDDTLPSVGL